jgi:hypothetical protein
MTVGLIFINLCVLIALFSFPPISLLKDHGFDSDKHDRYELLGSAANSLIISELEKANNEIQMRLSDQSTWFQYKFVFVGALLAAFIGVFPYAHLRGRIGESSVLMNNALKSQPATVGLAAVCSLSLMIDLHIRGNACR